MPLESGAMIPFRGTAEIVGRLDLPAASSVLLVETPAELESMLIGAAAPGAFVRSSEAKHVRSIKETFDLMVLWQESRVGSRALFEAAVKRLAPEGRLWVVTAMRKVSHDPRDSPTGGERPGLAGRTDPGLRPASRRGTRPIDS
jgi:hypothetical protein